MVWLIHYGAYGGRRVTLPSAILSGRKVVTHHAGRKGGGGERPEMCGWKEGRERGGEGRWKGVGDIVGGREQWAVVIMG